MENREQEISLDLRDIFEVIRKRFWMIVAITLAATILSGLISFFVLKPVYEAKISIVISKAQEKTEKQQYDYNDIMMYQNLVKTYAEIAKSRTVAQKTIDKLKIKDMTPEVLQGQITVTPQANTQIMDLKVKNIVPIAAMNTVNVLADFFIQESKRIYPQGNIQIIDNAVLPKSPVSPNKKLNVAIAFFLGLMLSLGISFMMEFMDRTIKTEIDVEKYLDIPVIGIIPKNFD
jgi:capsular polysaccharide biosynthesis protein